MNEARVVDMVKVLSGKLTVAPTGKGGKEQVRDIAGIALKTIVTEVYGTTATGVVETLTPLLVDAIEKVRRCSTFAIGCLGATKFFAESPNTLL